MAELVSPFVTGNVGYAGAPGTRFVARCNGANLTECVFHHCCHCDCANSLVGRQALAGRQSIADLRSAHPAPSATAARPPRLAERNPLRRPSADPRAPSPKLPRAVTRARTSLSTPIPSAREHLSTGLAPRG